MKVYEAVIELLHRSGVRYYSGLVGSTTAPYVSQLATGAFGRYVPVRHEQVAAAVVDATARLTGVPGCLLVHGASGALAASLGIAAAARDATPMIVLSATQERVAMERGWWQTLDVLQPMRGFVKWQTRVERPEVALEAVRRGLREAVSGRPGVAQIDLPIDVSTSELAGSQVTEDIAYRAPLYRTWPDPSSYDQVRSLLAQADRPILLIGGGAGYSRAGSAIMRLAELLQAPVVNTPTSRGVVPETHPLVLGASGILGYEPVGQAITEADLIVAIGSRLSDLQLARGELVAAGVPIVQVDVSAEVVGQSREVAIGICSDARAFTDGLVTLLEREPLPVPSARRDWAEAAGRRVREWEQAWLSGAPDNGLVQPQEIVDEMRRQLAPETILTHGAGDHGFYGYLHRVAGQGAHLVSARLGALGCALGYAMGAKLARPTLPVVACVGDGEFMLQLGDLETMVREQLPATVVVFNNFRFGSQRKRVELYGPVTGVDHGNPDFARLAETFGATGIRVDRPGRFAEAFASARAQEGPTVIDCLIDPDTRPPRINISREAR